MSWSEEALHAFLFELRAAADPSGDAAAATVGAAGSDAAVLRAPLRRPVVCADQVVAGRHFTADADPAAVGHKAAARALSDLAATAATPRALVCVLRATPDADQSWLEAALRGVWDTGLACGAPLVGGDVGGGDGPTSLAVTALGDFEFDGAPPGREHARPGDVVLLTGPVGGSAAGRHLSFRPRLTEGRWLYAGGARVLMDVSDGLALDLARIAARSDCAVRLDVEAVPVHADARAAAATSGRTPLAHALGDGEDHELLAIASPAVAAELLRRRAEGAPGLVRIGTVAAGEGLWTRSGADWERVERPAGYRHEG